MNPSLSGRLFRFAFRLPLVIAAASSLHSCSGESSGPAGSTLEVTFATPAQDDGAVLFSVTGGPVDSVETAGYTLYSARPDPNTLLVIVTGDLSGGAIARLHIPDEHLTPQYSATVNQVAARTTYVQRDPREYSLTLIP